MYSDDLVAGQLAAFAGLGALRHLDLRSGRRDARYSAVTPKRAEATCLIFERRLSPALSGMSLSICSRPSTDATRVAVFHALSPVRSSAR